MTAIPGTTRDVLQLTLDIGGLPVVVSDTAGLRETDDFIEGIGVQRGIEAYVFLKLLLFWVSSTPPRIKSADISLCVLPLPDILNAVGKLTIPQSVCHLITHNTFFLLNKVDLVPPCDLSEALVNVSELCGVKMLNRIWATSITTGAGAPEFVEGLAQGLKAQ